MTEIGQRFFFLLEDRQVEPEWAIHVNVNCNEVTHTHNIVKVGNIRAHAGSYDL